MKVKKKVSWNTVTYHGDDIVSYLDMLFPYEEDAKRIVSVIHELNKWIILYNVPEPKPE